MWPGIIHVLRHCPSVNWTRLRHVTGYGTEILQGLPLSVRITGISDTALGNSLYSWNIPANNYAPDSAIWAMSDSANGNSSYGYDALNRVAFSYQHNGQEAYNYDYDRFGNRWHQYGPHQMILTFS